MKTYTLQQAQQLVADGKAFIENDVDDINILKCFLKPIGSYTFFWKWKYYSKDYVSDIVNENLIDLIHIKLSQIQPEPIPNDVLKIVEKYGDKLLTYYELLKK